MFVIVFYECFCKCVKSACAVRVLNGWFVLGFVFVLEHVLGACSCRCVCVCQRSVFTTVTTCSNIFLEVFVSVCVLGVLFFKYEIRVGVCTCVHVQTILFAFAFMPTFCVRICACNRSMFHEFMLVFIEELVIEHTFRNTIRGCIRRGGGGFTKK